MVRFDGELGRSLMADVGPTIVAVGHYVNPVDPSPKNPGGYFALYETPRSGREGVLALTPTPMKDLNAFKAQVRSEAERGFVFKGQRDVGAWIFEMNKNPDRAKFKFRYVGSFDASKPESLVGWFKGLLGGF